MASRMPGLGLNKDKGNINQKQCGRVKVDEYDPAARRRSLEKCLKSVGANNAFDLHCYKSLPVSFAARGGDMAKMHTWVMAILSENPQGRLLVRHWFLLVFVLVVTLVI